MLMAAAFHVLLFTLCVVPSQKQQLVKQVITRPDFMQQSCCPKAKFGKL